MKKVVINIVLILIAYVIFCLQSNFFSWFNIAGIKPNLFIIYILFIGLFGNRVIGVTYGIIIGAILDIIFNEKVGANLIGLSIIGVIATIFNKNFSKDSRITIMFMVFGSTVLFEVISYFINYILFAINIELVSFLKILSIEVIYNMLITIIIYPVIQKFGYYIENEYKENKILTRYF